MAVARTVTACLIARDEQHQIGACLASLVDRVDEIVVVDTGSTDATVDEAERFGAHVLHHPWNDDFSAPRNRALKAATSDWVFQIDADERLHLTECARLNDILPQDEALAAQVLLRPKAGFTPYADIRLFRNDPRLCYEGMIHERITPSLRSLDPQAAKDLPVLRQITLDHVGYDGDQTQKHARNEPILRKALEMEPERVYSWFHLAVTLDATGRQDEAIDAAERAAHLAGQSLYAEDHIVGSSACQFLAEAALNKGAPTRAIALAEQGLELCADNHALVWTLANAWLSHARPDRALKLAAPLLEIDPEVYLHTGLAFDTALFRRDAHMLIASCHFEAGDLNAADRHFEAALAHGADPLEIRVKRALCQTPNADG